MSLQILKYSLPFKKPFATSKGEYVLREGYLLRFEKDEVVAYGDVAPLPGFSVETIDDVEHQLKENKHRLTALLSGTDRSLILNELEKLALFPSLEFGFDTLLIDYLSQKEKLSFSAYLFGEIKEPIQVNAVIGSMDPRQALEQVAFAHQHGFRTIKLKVGISLQKELEIIKRIRNTIPQMHIRLDANATWTVAEAISALNFFEEYDIEYCEQPCRSIEEIKEVKNSISIRVAADESIRSYQDVQQIIGNKAADIFIIKPMLMGHLGRISVTNQLAKSHNIEVVYTTSLESVVGRTATAHLAIGSGSKQFAHGLATGSLLKSDLSSYSLIQHGSCSPQNSIGLGIRDLDSSLEQLSHIA